MKMAKSIPSRWTLLLALTALLAVGCGATHETEQTLIAWGGPLNAHLATTPGNMFPASLNDIDSTLRLSLDTVDGWGNKLKYRRVIDDRYMLISAGPNGTYGDDDDIVLMNGALYDGPQAYARFKYKE